MGAFAAQRAGANLALKLRLGGELMKDDTRRLFFTNPKPLRNAALAHQFWCEAFDEGLDACIDHDGAN